MLNLAINTAYASPARASVSEFMQSRSYDKQEVLFSEGDMARNVYEVVDGIVRVSKVFADGCRQIISFAFPGDIIGLGEPDEYRFDADALTPATIRVSTRSQLFARASQNAELGQQLLHVAVSEINSVQNHSILLCRKTAVQRLASFLLGIAMRTGHGENETVGLPMSRADIADYLGLTIETVSRNFTKLRRSGVVSVQTPGTFIVRDMESLQQLADLEDNLN